MEMEYTDFHLVLGQAAFLLLKRGKDRSSFISIKTKRDIGTYEIGKSKENLTFFHATEERISGVSRHATAHRVVIDNLTVSILTTIAWAWIPTLLIDASRVLSAIRTNYALWFTLRRTSDIVWLTGTNCMIVDHATITVRATGRLLAWVALNWCY